MVPPCVLRFLGDGIGPKSCEVRPLNRASVVKRTTQSPLHCETKTPKRRGTRTRIDIATGGSRRECHGTPQRQICNFEWKEGSGDRPGTARLVPNCFARGDNLVGWLHPVPRSCNRSEWRWAVRPWRRRYDSRSLRMLGYRWVLSARTSRKTMLLLFMLGQMASRTRISRATSSPSVS